METIYEDRMGFTPIDVTVEKLSLSPIVAADAFAVEFR
jgi:hypothetical protein